MTTSGTDTDRPDDAVAKMTVSDLGQGSTVVWLTEGDVREVRSSTRMVEIEVLEQ